MHRTDIPVGTVTFLFTDIEGSTKLWEAHPEAMRGALARHDALMRAAVVSSNGYVFKTIGDAFCVAFGTAQEAVQAAINAQVALAAEAWPGETPIRVRMGLHTGAVESRDNDYFGPPVNRVARLLATAHGGQSVLTLTTYELVRDSMPAGVVLKDLGSHQLRDLARPEQVFQLLHPALQYDFPPLRSLSNQPNNLPLQLTSFVGRQAEIERVQALFDRSRLVTLTGSGGSGKTRLSLQIAADELDQFPEGAWLIELASLTDPGMVARTVADVLGVPESPGQDVAKGVAGAIGSKAMLLILDNCEHLIEACAKFADVLLRACPRLKVLATSREALGIAGESTFRVPPLTLPDLKAHQTPATLSQFEAVRLFIDRAVQAESTFTVTNESAPALASLCCRLDGIPLAIELAAARVRSLPVEQIDARLDQRFRLLTGGSRAALPRQQTLRSLIDWSYDLLLPKEQVLLQRLSVFSGGWTLDCSETVCQDEETEGWEVADLVLALVDKSLVVAQEHLGVPRFSLLESVREYAKERLTEAGELEKYQDRHLACFLAMSAEARPHLRGPLQKVWFERLEAELDNFRAALAWGIGTGAGLSLAGDLWRFWYQRGHAVEGRAWLAAALARNPDAEPEDRARALNGAGVLAEYQADYEVALAQHQQSLEISRSRGARWFEAMSLNNIGNVYGSKGDYETGAGYWEQSLALWRELEAEGALGDLRGLAATLDNLGNVASYRGNPEEARGLYLECLAMRRQLGNAAGVAYSLLNLGWLSRELGDLESASAQFREGIQLSADIRDDYAIGFFLQGLAADATPSTAVALLGRFERIREDLGTPLTPGDAAAQESIVEVARLALGEQEFAAGWARGRAMTVSQAVDLALAS